MIANQLNLHRIAVDHPLVVALVATGRYWPCDAPVFFPENAAQDSGPWPLRRLLNDLAGDLKRTAFGWNNHE